MVVLYNRDLYSIFSYLYLIFVHFYSIFLFIFYLYIFLLYNCLFTFNLCSLLFYNRLFILDVLDLYSIVKAQQNLHNELCALLGLTRVVGWDGHIGAGRLKVGAMMNWVDGLGLGGGLGFGVGVGVGWVSGVCLVLG